MLIQHFGLTIQPPKSYSVGGQRSSRAAAGKPAGARPDYRGRWCARQLFGALVQRFGARGLVPRHLGLGGAHTLEASVLDARCSVLSARTSMLRCSTLGAWRLGARCTHLDTRRFGARRSVLGACILTLRCSTLGARTLTLGAQCMHLNARRFDTRRSVHAPRCSTLQRSVHAP
ncbi:UNVERIFIED_CONTAM: hypothetical protein FKN15_007906 [Acipenser sinensis]